MALKAVYLADKSALARSSHPEVARRLEPMIRRGAIASCSILELEYLFSARSPRDYATTRAWLKLAFETVAIEQRTLDRAKAAQSMLAARSRHRGVPIPDLIIAAAAELAGLTVLHYDADFELIAGVTKQPVEWVVPAGSVS